MFSSAFSSAFATAAGFITPMLAQEALFAGASTRYAAGSLVIGGKVLIGLSGRPYRFASESTAATWAASGIRVIEAERALVDRLGVAARSVWIAGKREKLLTRAGAIFERAMQQTNEKKRLALIGEALWCEAKWDE